MSIIKFAVIFTLISLPFYFITDYQLQQILVGENMKEQYETIINNAIDDGTLALRLFVQESLEQEHKKELQLDQKEVLNAFLASYHYGFKAISKSEQQKVDQYILGIIIIDYDGYYVYGTQKVRALDGSSVFRQVLSEKYPFIYTTNNHTMFMTLDNHVTVINRETWAKEEGEVADISTLPVGVSVDGYDHFRRSTIGNNIEEALQLVVENHNKYTQIQGMSYEFYLPIADNDFQNMPISDVGLLVFIQGQPIGNKGYLEMSSLNQGSVLTRSDILGYQDGATHSYYYCTADCTHPHTDQPLKVFRSKEEAATAGYYPCKFVGK